MNVKFFLPAGIIVLIAGIAVYYQAPKPDAEVATQATATPEATPVTTSAVIDAAADAAVSTAIEAAVPADVTDPDLVSGAADAASFDAYSQYVDEADNEI